LLFWGAVSEISGGHMPNKVTGATDYLTVAGSPATYQVPNTAPYIAADTDYIWFQINENRRTATTAELIGYDFSKTFVKYLDTSPYTISEIAILKSGETLTASELIDVYKYFHLSAWWDGTLNLDGCIKQNRTTARSVWTVESVWDAEIMNYRAALATPLSVAQYNLLDALVKGLKTDLSITNLYDYFDQILIYANETEEAGLINIVQNLHHATNHSTSFTQYEGFTGDGASTYIDTGYNPSGFAGNFKQNNAGLGLYIRNNVLEADNSPSHGSMSVGAIKIGITPYRSSTASVSGRVWCNNGTELVINWGATSVGFSMVIRDGANSFYGFRNKTKSAQGTTASSSAVLNGNLFDGACNNGGSISQYNAHQVSIKIIMKCPSDAEQGKIVDRFEAYMDAHGKGVI
jgi:hypothetical protein